MQPLNPNPQDFVGANLRRAYRGAPMNAPSDHFDKLLARIAAKLAELHMTTPPKKVEPRLVALIRHRR